MQVIPGPRYVIAGFDGSPNSAEALRRAAVEARERHARLDVVRVIPRTGGVMRAPAAWFRLRGEVARLIPHTQHITTRLRIARGDPGTQLTRLAGRAEVLVIGARLNSGHGTPFGGDTVPTVLSNARCDVILCENGAEEEA
jgi:nucleotide-binding universal stress UspA family protein